MTHWTGYNSIPIGGSNPYYQCAGCFRSDPKINGEVEKHGYNCPEVYRFWQESEISERDKKIQELEERIDHLELRLGVKWPRK